MIDFLGIGAQKSGTTWLFTQLQAHPAVRFPAGKEVHFWDAQRERGAAWWLGLFPEAPPGVRQGEITPAYGMLDREVIAEVRRAAPHLRLFYAMRNPIARAWSSALMALGRAEMTIDEASDQWFLDHFRSRGSRRRGDFVRCIDEWRSVFPEESLLLILLDDIAADPRGVLSRLADHLEIARDPFLEAGEDTLRQRVFEGPPHDLRPSLLGPLRDMYAASIRELGRRLGRDLSGWLEWDGRHPVFPRG